MRIARLTKKQDKKREHFGEMPIGTRFVIIKDLDLPAYDVLGFFFEYPPQQFSEQGLGAELYTGYVEKGTWEYEPQRESQIKRFIEEKEEEYIEFRAKLYHDYSVAQRLGFDLQKDKIESDRKWAMDIIDLIREAKKLL